MAKIVFICTMNRFRSPMAAAIARKLRPDLVIESAGLAFSTDQKRVGSVIKPHVHRPAPALRDFLARRGMDISEHRSHRLTAHDVKSADLVIVMTNRHKAQVLQSFPKGREKVRLLADYEIFDNWKPLTDEKLKRMYALIYPAVEKLLATL
jgi:protein-tyrosine-phosphatase